MLSRLVRAGLPFVFGAMLVAGPANATSITPGSTTALAPDVYVAFHLFSGSNPPAFTDNYNFTVTDPSLLTVSYATTVSWLRLPTLTYDWLFTNNNVTTSLIGGPHTVNSSTVATLVGLALPTPVTGAGFYTWRLSGDPTSGGANYTSVIDVTQTPLPGALLLFLGGGGVLGLVARRRKNRPGTDAATLELSAA